MSNGRTVNECEYKESESGWIKSVCFRNDRLSRKTRWKAKGLKKKRRRRRREKP
jgi:hypothetical protein